MGLKDLLQPFTWALYSKKMAEKIQKPRNAGFFTKEDAKSRQMRYVEAREGKAEEGNIICLYFLVDEEDGVIVDAKFQVFGESALIAAADAACELLVGKNILQAKRVTAELIDKQLRDKEEMAFPEETWPHLNMVIDVVDKATESCLDIMPQSYQNPLPRDMTDKEKSGYPNFLELPHPRKLEIIEEILNEEVRPYIELDSGGIEILDLLHNKELIISYKGSCTSCHSSIGATLSTIQHIVQTKVHPDIVVVPNMDDLKF